MNKNTRRKISRINKNFHETSHGELLAVFNISGYLEIAQNKENLADLLLLSHGANIIARFSDKK